MSSRYAHRSLMAAAVFTTLISLGSAAQAEWPEKPIRFIVNAAAGGAADGTSRILAKVWERGWRSMAAIRTGTGPGRAALLSDDRSTG